MKLDKVIVSFALLIGYENEFHDAPRPKTISVTDSSLWGNGVGDEALHLKVMKRQVN